MSFIFARWPAPRGVFAGYAEPETNGLDNLNEVEKFSFGLDEDASTVKQNRTLLNQVVGIESIQWMLQVHGNKVFESTGSTINDFPEADGVWTKEIGKALAVTTADCVPLVLTDMKGSFVSISHFGWRGALNGLIDTLFDSVPQAQSYVAWLGPSICGSCYEVGRDVLNKLDAISKSKFCKPDEKLLLAKTVNVLNHDVRRFFDLAGYIEHLLLHRGVVISRAHRCTMHERGLYSYRRNPVAGRFATLVWHT